MPVFASGLGVISLDATTGGALQDISAGVESFSLSGEQNTGEWFTMSSRWGQTLEGGKTWSLELTVIGEDTAAVSACSIISQWFHSTVNGSRSIRIDQPTATTGSVRYEGETILVSPGMLANGVAGSGDPIKSSVRLRGTGTLIRSIIV